MSKLLHKIQDKLSHHNSNNNNNNNHFGDQKSRSNTQQQGLLHRNAKEAHIIQHPHLNASSNNNANDQSTLLTNSVIEDEANLVAEQERILHPTKPLVNSRSSFNVAPVHSQTQVPTSRNVSRHHTLGSMPATNSNIINTHDISNNNNTITNAVDDVRAAPIVHSDTTHSMSDLTAASQRQRNVLPSNYGGTAFTDVEEPETEEENRLNMHYTGNNNGPTRSVSILDAAKLLRKKSMSTTKSDNGEAVLKEGSIQVSAPYNVVGHHGREKGTVGKGEPVNESHPLPTIPVTNTSKFGKSASSSALSSLSHTSTANDNGNIIAKHVEYIDEDAKHKSKHLHRVDTTNKHHQHGHQHPIAPAGAEEIHISAPFNVHGHHGRDMGTVGSGEPVAEPFAPEPSTHDLLVAGTGVTDTNQTVSSTVAPAIPIHRQEMEATNGHFNAHSHTAPLNATTTSVPSASTFGNDDTSTPITLPVLSSLKQSGADDHASTKSLVNEPMSTPTRILEAQEATKLAEEEQRTSLNSDRLMNQPAANFARFSEEQRSSFDYGTSVPSQTSFNRMPMQEADRRAAVDSLAASSSTTAVLDNLGNRSVSTESREPVASVVPTIVTTTTTTSTKRDEVHPNTGNVVTNDRFNDVSLQKDLGAYESLRTFQPRPTLSSSSTTTNNNNNNNWSALNNNNNNNSGITGTSSASSSSAPIAFDRQSISSSTLSVPSSIRPPHHRDVSSVDDDEPFLPPTPAPSRVSAIHSSFLRSSSPHSSLATSTHNTIEPLHQQQSQQEEESSSTSTPLSSVHSSRATAGSSGIYTQNSLDHGIAGQVAGMSNGGEQFSNSSSTSSPSSSLRQFGGAPSPSTASSTTTTTRLDREVLQSNYSKATTANALNSSTPTTLSSSVLGDDADSTRSLVSEPILQTTNALKEAYVDVQESQRQQSGWLRDEIVTDDGRSITHGVAEEVLGEVEKPSEDLEAGLSNVETLKNQNASSPLYETEFKDDVDMSNRMDDDRARDVMADINSSSSGMDALRSLQDGTASQSKSFTASPSALSEESKSWRDTSGGRENYESQQEFIKNDDSKPVDHSLANSFFSSAMKHRSLSDEADVAEETVPSVGEVTADARPALEAFPSPTDLEQQRQAVENLGISPNNESDFNQDEAKNEYSEDESSVVENLPSTEAASYTRLHQEEPASADEEVDDELYRPDLPSTYYLSNYQGDSVDSVIPPSQIDKDMLALKNHSASSLNHKSITPASAFNLAFNDVLNGPPTPNTTDSSPFAYFNKFRDENMPTPTRGETDSTVANFGSSVTSERTEMTDLGGNIEGAGFDVYGGNGKEDDEVSTASSSTAHNLRESRSSSAFTPSKPLSTLSEVNDVQNEDLNIDDSGRSSQGRTASSSARDTRNTTPALMNLLKQYEVPSPLMSLTPDKVGVNDDREKGNLPTYAIIDETPGEIAGHSSNFGQDEKLTNDEAVQEEMTLEQTPLLEQSKDQMKSMEEPVAEEDAFKADLKISEDRDEQYASLPIEHPNPMPNFLTGQEGCNLSSTAEHFSSISKEVEIPERQTGQNDTSASKASDSEADALAHHVQQMNAENLEQVASYKPNNDGLPVASIANNTSSEAVRKGMDENNEQDASDNSYKPEVSYHANEQGKTIPIIFQVPEDDEDEEDDVSRSSSSSEASDAREFENTSGSKFNKEADRLEANELLNSQREDSRSLSGFVTPVLPGAFPMDYLEDQSSDENDDDEYDSDDSVKNGNVNAAFQEQSKTNLRNLHVSQEPMEPHSTPCLPYTGLGLDEQRGVTEDELERRCEGLESELHEL